MSAAAVQFMKRLCYGRSAAAAATAAHAPAIEDGVVEDLVVELLMKLLLLLLMLMMIGRSMSWLMLLKADILRRTSALLWRDIVAESGECLGEAHVLAAASSTADWLIVKILAADNGRNSLGRRVG